MIVGLGNPGVEYAKSRHNVGFRCVDRFAQQHGLTFSKHQAKAVLAFGTVADKKVILAKPMTYMNLSGQAVAPLARFYKIAPTDILVVCDDLDLPLGRIRLRPSGGSAGHKGMMSIIDSLGTEAFPRLRIGIGRPAGHRDPVEFVLEPFGEDEAIVIDRVLDRAVQAIVVFLAEGIDAAMNRFNSAI